MNAARLKWHRTLIRAARAIDRPLGRFIARHYDRQVDIEEAMQR